MRNAGLEEAQAGIKIAGRNINNLRYADDTTLMGRKWRGTKKPLDESERGQWKSWLKAQHQKTKIMASGPITSWEIDGETVETVSDFIFGGSKITADGDCSHEIKRRLLLGKGFPDGPEVKASACNTGDLGSIPGLGRSSVEGNGNPFQYSCLKNPMDRRAWQATVHGVTKMYGCESWTVKKA